MIGNNAITLNAATVMAALQHYFKNVLYQPDTCPEVVGLDYNNQDHTIRVSVKSASPSPKV